MPAFVGTDAAKALRVLEPFDMLLNRATAKQRAHWWSGEWWSSLPIRDLTTPLRRDLVLQPRRMRIRLANLCNVARLAHRRKVPRREVVRTGESEHVANLDRPPWPFGENRKNVVRHIPASALR